MFFVISILSGLKIFNLYAPQYLFLVAQKISVILGRGRADPAPITKFNNMPHIIIEHSSDISSDATNNFLPEIQKTIALVKEGNFDLEACKARAISFDKYFVGSANHEKSSFFHITVKILEGRSLEIKKFLAQKIFDEARKFLQDKELKERADLSVDIVDMNRQAYQKISL